MFSKLFNEEEQLVHGKKGSAQEKMVTYELKGSKRARKSEDPKA